MEKISVLMGIYNCAETIDEAIESVQSQTYTNWELILCDDGSTDGTYAKACQYAKRDERIVVLKNDHNLGLNITLNNCLKKATGEYIARMDGDDICVSDRFEKQVAFLEEYPDYSIVSSHMILFDENGEWGRKQTKEAPSAEDVVCGSPICHAPVMMRRACMEAVNGYSVDKRMLRVEDVNLWIKLYAAGYRCYNIQEPLYCMRNDRNALNRRKYRYRINSTYARLKGCRDLNLGWKSYLKAFLPMMIGLIPAKIRYNLRRRMS